MTPPGRLQSWMLALMPVAATPRLPAATLARRAPPVGRLAETVASMTAVAVATTAEACCVAAAAAVAARTTTGFSRRHDVVDATMRANRQRRIAGVTPRVIVDLVPSRQTVRIL